MAFSPHSQRPAALADDHELMTPHEAARWFRRSPSWLRQQTDLLKVGSPGGQPLYHVQVCRAWVLGRLNGQRGPALRQIQIAALAKVCGVDEDTLRPATDGLVAPQPAATSATAAPESDAAAEPGPTADAI